MNRMTQLHIQYLAEMIEEGGKFADDAKRELAEIKAEFSAQGVVVT